MLISNLKDLLIARTSAYILSPELINSSIRLGIAATNLALYTNISNDEGNFSSDDAEACTGYAPLIISYATYIALSAKALDEPSDLLWTQARYEMDIWRMLVKKADIETETEPETED